MNANPAVLSRTELVAALAMKIALGFLYGFIFLTFYGGDDTWKHHMYSLQETNLLLTNPHLFFVNEYTPAHALSDGRNFTEVFTLYLNDLQYAMLVKSLAFLNLVTNGNYYLNVAFFNLLVFCGHYWLFSSLVRIFPLQRRAFYLACFFYLPAVFWLSGLRIDGLLFFFLALFIYKMTQPASASKAIVLILAFFGIFICRIEAAALLVPAFMAYTWSRSKRRSITFFCLVYACALIFFLSSTLWMPNGGLTAIVAAKQHAFLELKGTRFSLHPLSADPVSYAVALPQAFANTFLRPTFWEAQGMLQWMASAEIALFWIFVIFIIWQRKPEWMQVIRHPIVLFMLFFSISLYLSIGFLVPFPGAIIRYKACGLLLLITSGLSLSKLR